MEGITLKTTNPADQIALRGVRVRATLVAMSQRTVVEQTFVNREPRAIEAVYTFPLPDGAAVCGFEVITGDRVLTGVVEETDQAIEKYETAISNGDAAFMAEQERPDVFTVRVGNINPGQAATIRLTYVAALDATDNKIRVAFPTVIAPRYVTASGADPIDAAIDGDALNPPHVLSVPYGLTFEADVRLGRKVRAITSPTHALRVDRDDEAGYRVALAGIAKMDREVVLSIELAKEIGPAVQVESGRGRESYLAVTFVPEFDEQELTHRPALPSETVFVLDCSGSMAGESIEQATTALELCLRSLSEGDTFNICKFGSTFELMSSEPLVYAEPTLQRALGYVHQIRDFGGTELFAPLEAILRAPPATGACRSIVLLTDGQVSNEPAILDLARRQRGRNRIFSFGIGPACSSFLVRGLARATGGAAEFIAYGERIEEKVLRTFARLASPMASEVEIDWGGADVQTLAELPPVFDGEVMTVYGRALGTAPKTVTLRCRTSSGAKDWSVDVPPHAAALADGSRVIGAMWARRTIQSLEEVNGIHRSARVGNDSRERAMLVQLSKEFGLLSSLTTFITVEHRSLEERNAGRPATRRVPVALAQGWGDIDLAGGAACGGAMPAAAPAQSRAWTGAAPVGDPSKWRLPRRRSQILASRKLDPGKLYDLIDKDVRRPLTPSKQAEFEKSDAETADVLRQLLATQSAAGAFGRAPDVTALAKQAFPNWSDQGAELERACVAIMPADDPAIMTAVIATVEGLLLLRSVFAADAATWKRAADKAIRYLAKLSGRSVAEIENWLVKLQLDG